MGNCIVNNISKSKNVYSTDEIEIGTWLDGKKIYRKLIANNATSETGFLNIDISNLKVDTFIRAEGTFKFSNISTSIFNFPIGTPYNSAFVEYKTNGNVNVATYSSGSLTSANSIYLFLEYTKTTD